MRFKHFFTYSLICLLVFSGLAFSSEIESFTINGLKVIFKQNTSTDIVSANMYFRGGCTLLDLDQAGIENFMLTVAQKATQNYPKDELNAALEEMNTRVSHSTNPDYSSLNMQCVKQNFKRSWDIFTDMILHPLFDPADVELERKKLLSAVKQRKDDPDSYVDMLLNESFYANHPYSIDENGTEITLSSFSAEDLKKFNQRRLETSQLLLVVVGNTTRSELEKLVKKSFSNLPVGSFQAEKPPMVQTSEPSIKIVQRDLPTKYIRGNFAAPGFGTEESYAMQIATSILRDRLFEEVRTKRGLSYAPGAGYGSHFSAYGYIYVTAVDPDTTIQVMQDEVKKLIDQPVPLKDLNNKINQFITRFYMSNETNRAQAELLAKYELSGAGYQEYLRFIERLKNLTPEGVHEVCQKYMKNFQFVLLGNPESLQVGRFMF
ncbi:MAG: pitrilysin family protein [Calditrichia bacterium]